MVAAVDDADVGVLAVDLSGQLAVLRTTPLDDVHPRHDLDPADQADTHGGRKHEDFLQGAVDAEPHPDDVLGGLDVDVRSPVTLGLGQDAGDDLDDGCVVGDDLGLGGFCHRGAATPSTASKASTRRSTPPMAW